jgi:hypothetical protein
MELPRSNIEVAMSARAAVSCELRFPKIKSETIQINPRCVKAFAEPGNMASQLAANGWRQTRGNSVLRIA